jgi:5'-nucleotidase
MRILLTNDDGINSPGILQLAAGLREAGHRVFVMAPNTDRSGVSHSISFLGGPIKIVQKADDTWSCFGTPVDCVVVSLLGAIPELGEALPEIIISGINRGANLGTDIVFSGTAAAARQGAFHDIPSLALSLAGRKPSPKIGPPIEGWNWDMSVAFVVKHLEEMLSFWKPGSFVNVNIPNRKEMPNSLVHSFPSFRYYNDSLETYHAPDGTRYCFIKPGEISASKDALDVKNAGAKPEKESDWEAVDGDNASLSVILIHPVLIGEK